MISLIYEAMLIYLLIFFIWIALDSQKIYLKFCAAILIIPFLLKALYLK